MTIAAALAFLRRAWPLIAIGLLATALFQTRATLARVKLETKAERAAAERDAATRYAVAAERSATAADAYASRVAAAQPLIVRSTDTVRTYAQTPAGRAACLGADRVRGLDAFDAALFTPAAPRAALTPCSPMPAYRQTDGTATSADAEATIRDGRADLRACEDKRRALVEAWLG